MRDIRQDLLLGLVEGNERIILEIYNTIFPKVLSFVLKNRGQKEDAEDIFQKVLVQIVARYKLRVFKINTSFEAYLFTASKNLWRRELNKQKKRVIGIDKRELVNEERDMALAVLEQERYELLYEKLQQLSDNCKKILQSVFSALSNKEILIKFGYNSENVVRQRVFKCKKKLVELIKKDGKYRTLRNL